MRPRRAARLSIRSAAVAVADVHLSRARAGGVAVDADAAITIVTSVIAMTIGRLIVDPLGALDGSRASPPAPRGVLMRWGLVAGRRPLIGSYRGRSEIAEIAVLSITASASASRMRPPRISVLAA